jgi:Tol biopolymer transport system component
MKTMISVLAVVVLVASNRSVPAQVTRLASVATDGTPTDAQSQLGDISADGRWVVFDSYATTLCEEPVTYFSNVFIHDMTTGQTALVSRRFDGNTGNGNSRSAVISADGRVVAFYSEAELLPDDHNFRGDAYVWDRVENQLSRASVSSQGIEGNGDSNYPSISADGRYVAFNSGADNLVPADRNGRIDIFVRDRQTGVTRRVNLGPHGQQGNGDSQWPKISGDGRFVAFWSQATNLVERDHNGVPDVFVAEVATANVTRVSVSSLGEEADGESDAFDFGAGISFDGRYVVFESEAGNLVPGDANAVSDVFLRDLALRATEPISVSADGAFGDGPSRYPSISDDGRYVTFMSFAANLVVPDINGGTDVFIKDRLSGALRIVSVDSSGAQGRCGYQGALSGDARSISYFACDGLVPGDTNGFNDVLVHGPMGEVKGLSHEKTGGSGHRLHWEAEAGQGLFYDVHSGSLAGLRSGLYDHEPLDGSASCGIASNVYDADDLNGTSGDRYYLVALHNAVGEGTLGTTSDGWRRPPSTVSCP